jgi:predicted N-acyltransferase
MMSPAFSVIDSLAGIAPAAWDALVGDQPLLSHAFFDALHATGCASDKTGWKPRFIVGHIGSELVAAMPLYLKLHSYGEYVFDWSWADAYGRYGRRYYPKLLGAVPFTPATGSRLIARDPAHRHALWRRAIELARATRASSLHVLFPESAEIGAIRDADVLHRHGIQFRWENQGYSTFDQFLATFSHDKRKKIKQDRAHVAKAGIDYRWLDGHTASGTDWDFFYRCYANTYRAHHSSPYLTREFFGRIAATMPDNVLLIVGSRDRLPHCAALNIMNSSTLWGRYWGTTGFVSGLHFETCYYQAIEYCIAKKIARFEGGAQGGHKLARGFLPVRTHSLHWIADPEFAAAIGEFLRRESTDIGQVLDELHESSPYKAA